MEESGPTVDTLASSAAQLRLELEELYSAYSACLDEERFEEWPDFFVDQCLYKIVPRSYRAKISSADCRSRPGSAKAGAIWLTASLRYAGQRFMRRAMFAEW